MVKWVLHQAEKMLTVNSVYTNVNSNHWLESLVWVVFIWAAQPVPFKASNILFLIITVIFIYLFLVMKHPWVAYSATSASSSDCRLQSVKLKEERRGLGLQHTVPHGCQRQELVYWLEAESTGTGWWVWIYYFVIAWEKQAVLLQVSISNVLRHNASGQKSLSCFNLILLPSAMLLKHPTDVLEIGSSFQAGPWVFWKQHNQCRVRRMEEGGGLNIFQRGFVAQLSTGQKRQQGKVPSAAYL